MGYGADVTKIKLPYIHSFRDRHGKLRHTFRKTGCKKVTLPGLPGSREFMDAYQACLENAPDRLEVGASSVKAGSISALIVQYYQSSDFKSLRPSTQKTYKGIIERFRTDYGALPVKGMEPKHVRAIIDKRSATPEAANNLLKMIRRLMQFAIERDWRDTDPARDVRKVKHKSDGFHSWTEAEIEQFEARFPIGTKERLAMALLLYTAQRRSDVVKMGRQHVKDGFILVCQEKTDTRLEIPIHPRLREVLANTSVDSMTYLTTRTGAPYVKESFGNWFRAACKAVGLPHCSSHGLRKAASRRLAEAGCTPHQIMAVTGHKSLKEVVTYTAAANQKRLAESALNSIEKDGRGTKNG